MVRKSKYAVAASTLIAAALVAWLTLGPTGGIAFADVVESIKQFKTARWKMTIEQGDQTHTFTYKAMEPGRMTWSDGKMGGAIVVDLTTGEAIMRNDSAKMVFEIPMPEGKADAAGMVAMLQQFDKRESKPLGTKTIDGVKCHGFGFETPDATFDVWVSIETKLPVRIEQEQTKEQTREQLDKAGVPEQVPAHDLKLTWSDFEWGIELDEADFSTAAPPGYMKLSLGEFGKQFAPHPPKPDIEAQE